MTEAGRATRAISRTLDLEPRDLLKMFSIVGQERQAVLQPVAAIKRSKSPTVFPRFRKDPRS